MGPPGDPTHLQHTMQLFTPEDLAALPEDDLLSSIEATKRRISELGSLLDAYLDDLSRRVDTGELDPQFSHDDWNFSLSPGSRSWDYPEQVLAMAQQLKAARRASEADGTATETRGAPYWTIRGPRS